MWRLMFCAGLRIPTPPRPSPRGGRGSDVVVEVLAFDVLGDEVEAAFCGAVVEEARDDVEAEGLEDVEFARGAGAGFFAESAGQDLERHGLVGALVVGEVDGAGGAAAEDGGDGVTAKAGLLVRGRVGEGAEEAASRGWVEGSAV